MENFTANMERGSRLLEIHESVTGSSAGRTHKAEVPDKSGIVLLVACWETFVEDCADTAFERLIDKAKSPDTSPAHVLPRASRPPWEHENERTVWELADESTSWRATETTSRAASAGS